MSNSRSNSLEKRYGFSSSQASQVREALEKDHRYITEFASMSLHVKGLGFLRSEIVEIVSHLGMNSTDLANWEGIASRRTFVGNDAWRAFLAYKSGLGTTQMNGMSEDDLTVEKLTLMAQIRNT